MAEIWRLFRGKMEEKGPVPNARSAQVFYWDSFSDRLSGNDGREGGLLL